MSIPDSIRACRLAVTAIVLAGAPLRAQTPASDAHALNRIFGDEYLANDVLDVCSRASQLSSEQRYAFLADRVLPGERHPTFRVIADFSPTYPAPPTSDAEIATGRRVPAGGEIISAALDLVDTAASLGRLEELRQRIEARMTTSVGSHIDQLALLALVDIARDDVESAKSNLSALFTLLLSVGTAEPPSNDAALLCVHAAAGRADLSVAVVEPAYRIVAPYRGVANRSVWQRQFSAAFARVRQAAGWNGDDSAIEGAATGLTQWFPASLPRARYRGAGTPVAQWNLGSGVADNLSSHDEDFLYFAVPLRGDFEVECDVVGSDWRDSQLLFAGNWVGPYYNLLSYEVGDIGGSLTRFGLNPRLTPIGEHGHCRTVVRNGSATTYFNGRRIHSQPLSADHDPWLAVRNGSRRDGGVRNLRITGDATVPEELRLSSAAGFAGWIPYLDEVSGIDWQYRDATGEIHAPRQREFPRGSALESALLYHRPMLEDGSIEYEFWYDPGECEAHPALDRLCFLLDQDGVRIHWLTDGLFDRTELAPDNLIDEPESRRGPGPLPLHDQAWNHLRLTVRGDDVDILLNGELVFQRRLEPTNQRNFGLFHYADRTELRVRNVIWKGDWPREIPGLDDQELVVHETDFLDERLPELTAVFSHDFTADGLPLDRFAVMQGELSDEIDARPDGLHVTKQASGGYQSAIIAPRLAVGGDFDITATFDQLAMDARGTGGGCNLFLWLAAGNEAGDECMMVRRQEFVRRRNDHLIQCVRVSRPDRRRYFGRHSMEAPSGTLRLARRDDRIYYLFAENDSTQFRLLSEESYTEDDLQMRAVRLDATINGEGGSNSVVWKNLTVRAEGLSGPAIDGLLKVDQER